MGQALSNACGSDSAKDENEKKPARQAKRRPREDDYLPATRKAQQGDNRNGNRGKEYSDDYDDDSQYSDETGDSETGTYSEGGDGEPQFPAAFPILRTGTNFLKYGRTGKPHMRYVLVSRAGRLICWGKDAYEANPIRAVMVHLLLPPFPFLRVL